MNKLNKFILFEIFYFLPNEDIFKLNKISCDFNDVTKDDTFIDNINYRNHPMVFNIIDNYCKICNLQMFFIFKDTELQTMSCSHCL